MNKTIFTSGHHSFTPNPQPITIISRRPLRSREITISQTTKRHATLESGLDFEGHKYTVRRDASGRVFALRYGQEWRDFTGDKLFFNMAEEIAILRARESILVDAMAEVLATSSGKSTQPIPAIVNGCMAELSSLST